MLANNDEILGNGPPVFDDAPMSPGEHEYLETYDVDADHNQKCDDYRRLCRNRARRRRMERTFSWFSFDEFEAWHEPGDWVTPDVVDAAHRCRRTPAKPLPTPSTPCRPLRRRPRGL